MLPVTAVKSLTPPVLLYTIIEEYLKQLELIRQKYFFKISDETDPDVIPSILLTLLRRRMFVVFLQIIATDVPEQFEK